MVISLVTLAVCCFQLIIQVTVENQIQKLVQRQEFTGMGVYWSGVAQIVSSGFLNSEIIWDKVGKALGAAEFLFGLECVFFGRLTLFEYQAWDTVFHHQMKHRKKELKTQRAAKNFWRNSRFFYLMMNSFLVNFILFFFLSRKRTNWQMNKNGEW